MPALVLGDAADSKRYQRAIELAQACGYIPRPCIGSTNRDRTKNFKRRYGSQRAVFQAAVIDFRNLLETDDVVEILQIVTQSGRPVLLYTEGHAERMIAVTARSLYPNAPIFTDVTEYLTQFDPDTPVQ